MLKSLNFVAAGTFGVALVAATANLMLSGEDSGSETVEAVAAAPVATETAAPVAVEVAKAEVTAAPMPKEPPMMQVAAAHMPATSAPSGEKLGLGRTALEDEVAAWDLDVSPDGTGLPVGSGSVEDGEEIFSEYCAVCHGEFAEGAGNWPKLAGGDDTLADEDPLKTVGSYWPYLSTAFDYVHRSMPFGAAQTMSVDETYAIVAYILYSNYLVEDDFVLSNENFLEVEMPNANGFIIDDRDTTEAHFWNAEPCMSNCKDSVEITMRAAVLDVTPEEEGEGAASSMSDDHGAMPSLNMAEPAAVAAGAAEVMAEAAAPAAIDADLAKAGEKVFKKCKACHKVGEGAKNGTGPMLNGIIDAPIAAVAGFKYSNDFTNATGVVWDAATLDQFLTKPKDMFKRTKMSFAGLKKEKDRAAVIEYLKTFE